MLTNKNKEFVFQKLKQTKKGLVSCPEKEDRICEKMDLIDVKHVDLCYRENLQKIREILVNSFNYLKIGKTNLLKLNFDKVEVTRLLSTGQSDSQCWHQDYAGNWATYFKSFMRHKMVPLSILHFPEGNF